MKNISLNELPKYSHWINRILGVEEFKVKNKNPKEVMREYNTEKWADVLQYLKNHPSITIDDFEKYIFKENIVSFQKDKDFFINSSFNSHTYQLELYLKNMTSYIDGCESIVELGAGYGSIILNLMKKIQQKNLNYFAGEYTENGLKTLKILADNSDLKLEIGKCDFYSLTLDEVFNMSSKPLVFTSYSLMYVPLLNDSLIDYIYQLHPQYCIHFEPCYEHYAVDELHGIMCRRYIELNDYNTNLVSILKKAEQQGKIEIIKEDKNIFGNNPLLPISIVAWRFRK